MQLLPIEIIFNLHPLISKVCFIKLLNSWSLTFFSGHRFHSNLGLISLVGTQIILSQILAIQNNNHTQEHNIYVENPFSWREKNTGQTLNNFTIIKSITIILVYVSQLKKNLSFFFFALTHTLIIFFKCSNTLLPPPRLSFWRQQPYALPSFLLCSSQAKILFLSLDFTLYFPSLHIEDPWAKAKAIKFFVALSIYKTFLLFPLGLRMHYLFNKESIPLGLGIHYIFNKE